MLLHPTSLPSGTLDGDADRFLDWLAAGGFAAWQMLPVGPVGLHGSPYSSLSAFAGHVGLLPAAASAESLDRDDLAVFAERERLWLDDYALFTVIRGRHPGRPWWEWPRELRHRDPIALRRFAREHHEALCACREAQYRFARHWQRLRLSASRRGVLLIGDLPMFVVADSADAWSRPALFRMDSDGRRESVAGVPPDAFSATGQCWDNPVFDWKVLIETGFDWWLRRLQTALSRFDRVRWDHFRGLAATWEIPIGPDGSPLPAVRGRWRDVPGRRLLERLREALGPLPIIAENLGVITEDVERLRRDFGLPGLHVLQFAFDGSPDNPHRPENHEENGVACTGTHDNDTTLGWWQALGETERSRVRATLGSAELVMPDALIEAALESRCRLAMIPLQDLLRLDGSARMNRPGIAAGQWRWRLRREQPTAPLAAHWRDRVTAAARG